MTGQVGKTLHPKQIAIIGAGIGGMCAAARLAKAGHHVKIYEASDRTGGTCRTEWIGNYAFDTGPSLLTLPAVYRDFFARTGEVLGRVIELKAVDPSFEYRFADGSKVAFANLSRKRTLAAIAQSLGESAAHEWDQIMRRAESMWDVSREPFIESELKSPFSLLKRPTLLRDLRIIAPLRTIRSLRVSHPKLRNILDRYATYSGSDPRIAPAVLSSIAFVEEAFGAWHIPGGIGTLSEKIEARCRNLGVEFELKTKVERVLHHNGSVTGIKVSDGTISNFDLIVANTDAGLLYNSLLTGESRKLKAIRRSLKKSDPSFAGFSLLLGLKPSTDAKLNHHTILFPDNYDAEFDSIFSKKLPVPNPTIYICAPDDQLMVKDLGHQAWFVLVNAPIHATDGSGFDWSNSEFNHRYAEKIIDLIEANGISVRARLDVMEIRTPYDLQNSVAAPGGSIYGTSSNGPRSAFLRAKNRSPLKNLYLVGGSAHPGGGLPLVGLSAEIVATAILENDEFI